MSKKVKKIKPVQGMSIIDGALLLDAFSLSYIPEMNTIEIYSHYANISYRIKSDDLINFIEDHKQIKFGDF